MTPEQSPIRVLVAEDVTVLRRAIVSWLSRLVDIEVVGEAGNGQEAVDAVDALRPDVVLMDMRMPVLDGIEATRRITMRHPGTAVLLLSAYGEQSFIDEGMNAGARGYLFKDFSPRTLELAIYRVARSAPVAAAAAVGSDSSTGDRSLPNGTKVIDRDIAASVVAVYDDNEELHELLALFADDGAARIGRLRNAVAGDDTRAVAADAHALRGAGAAFGAARVVELASQLEQRAQAGRLAGADTTVDDLEHEFGRAVDELRTVWAQ